MRILSVLILSVFIYGCVTEPIKSISGSENINLSADSSTCNKLLKDFKAAGVETTFVYEFMAGDSSLQCLQRKEIADLIKKKCEFRGAVKGQFDMPQLSRMITKVSFDSDENREASKGLRNEAYLLKANYVLLSSLNLIQQGLVQRLEVGGSAYFCEGKIAHKTNSI